MSYPSYAEYLKHPKFRAVCDEVAERSRGRCEGYCLDDEENFERCSNDATEFHHQRYPKWGEFDVAKNLQHLCHKCHTRKHTCVNCGKIFGSGPIKQGSIFCSKCFDDLPRLLAEHLRNEQ